MRAGLVPAPGPLRTLALSSLLNSAGSSFTVTTLVLYFTRIVGLTGGHVALGLTLGGLAGLLVSLPLGHLADARGARGLLVLLLLVQAVSTLAFGVVDSLGAYLVVAVVDIALLRGSSAVRQGVIARTLPAEGRVRARAYLRSITNAGFAVGSASATVGIALDSRAGYRAMFALDALSCVVVALLILRLARLPAVPPAATGPRLVVLRDRPYLVVVLLTALLAVHNSMLDVGLPLWVSGHTEAPTAIVGVIFVVNCVAVSLFSVRLAAGSEEPLDAARAGRRAGGTLLAACAVMAVSGPLPAAACAVVLIVGMLLQATGEMQQAASQWGLSLGLAPDDRQGQYQGAATTGLALAALLGPVAMAGVVALGAAGWLAFGVLMLVAGAVTVPATRWALAARLTPGR